MNTTASRRSRLAITTIRLIAEDVASGAPPLAPELLAAMLNFAADALDPGFKPEDQITVTIERTLPTLSSN